ncbi:MAG: glycosyltransferase [Flavobacteriaceae bacterium]|nr:glycosyltransferase [Flavobacteriaceae bacterium]
MRILYCTNQLYVHGGIERILSQKINHLLDEGHEIFLTTFEQCDRPDVYPLVHKLSRFDLQIKYQTGYSYFHPKNLSKVIKHFFRLRQLIKKIKPDLIISISYTPDQFFLPFLSRSIPKVKELHSSGVVVGISGKEGRQSIKGKLTSVFKKYNALVVLNKDEISYFSGCNTFVIPNFTDFQPSSDSLELKEKTVIAAGRIAPVKQFHELIYIWKMIYLDFPDWKFKLFGDGDEKVTVGLENLIHSLDLSDSFLLLPSINNLEQEMEKASIYAMTSQTECFPMVLLEAKASAVPIVSYDCPYGPRNIIKNDLDGYLIAPNDRVSFADKLTELMRDSTLRTTMALNAKKNVSDFSKEKVMMQWNNLFTQIK